MRKVLMIALTIVLTGSAALAQGKIQTKWHCPKASAEPRLPVGDMANHNYALAQGTCTATASDKGFAEKSGAYTAFSEE